MTLVILSFAAGVLLLQLQPELPPAGWVGLAFLFPVVFFKGRILAIPFALLLGFCWALGLAHLRLADRLAPELEGEDIVVVGVVASLPAIGERGLRFEFEPESAPVPLPRKILLSWFRSPLAAMSEEQPALLGAPIHPGEPGTHTVARVDGWPGVGLLARVRGWWRRGLVALGLQHAAHCLQGRGAARQHGEIPVQVIEAGQPALRVRRDRQVVDVIAARSLLGLDAVQHARKA